MATKIEHLKKDERAARATRRREGKEEHEREVLAPATGLAVADAPSEEGLRQTGMTTRAAGGRLRAVVGVPGLVTGAGGFTKGFDPRRQVGRKPGSKNRKPEYPYRCPHCRRGIGRVRQRRGLEKARIPDWLMQIQRMKKFTGQPRRGRRRFERGPDPARCLSGRPIGKRDSYPRVPAYCKHCKQRIRKEWRRILVRRWRSEHP
jgi:hypothetical protein